MKKMKKRGKQNYQMMNEGKIPFTPLQHRLLSFQKPNKKQLNIVIDYVLNFFFVLLTDYFHLWMNIMTYCFVGGPLKMLKRLKWYYAFTHSITSSKHATKFWKITPNCALRKTLKVISNQKIKVSQPHTHTHTLSLSNSSFTSYQYKIAFHFSSKNKWRDIRFVWLNDIVWNEGFTRPKVLILVPFRNNCFEIVETMLELLPKLQRDRVQNKRKFYQEFFSETYIPYTPKLGESISSSSSNSINIIVLDWSVYICMCLQARYSYILVYD
jgi:hypothetical protein